MKYATHTFVMLQCGENFPISIPVTKHKPRRTILSSLIDALLELGQFTIFRFLMTKLLMLALSPDAAQTI